MSLLAKSDNPEINRIEQYINSGPFQLVAVNKPREKADRSISHYGMMGSTFNPALTETKPILKRGQLLQCIDSYMNDGTIRAMVNKRTDFIVGNRPKYMVEPNDVTTIDKLTAEALEAVMSAADVKKLKIKLNKIQKRVSFHEKLTNLVIQTFIIGRSAGGIEREINDDFPVFGEPIALKVLNSLRLKSPIINSRTHDLEGIFYDFGEIGKNNVPIPVINLLPMWYNDHNLYDNTLYTGMSAIWPLVSIAQANGYINDEDIPESAKSIWAKYGFVFVGDKNPESMTKFEQNSKAGTLMYHNNQNLDAKIFDLHNDLRELTDVRMANMKAMCVNFGFPMFLLFEDSANFATAKEVMQGFKAGVLERDRTWLRGFLEKYWYDPILADHLKIDDLDKLLDAKIKIKAAFDDVNYETRRDIVETDVQLLDRGVLEKIDVARDIDEDPEVIERLESTAEADFELAQKKKKLEVEALVKPKEPPKKQTSPATQK